MNTAAGKSSATSSSSSHVLVVEDEEHLAIGIRYNLEAEGYRVSTVGDGPAALELVQQDPEAIDLVVLDLMLPGMSGYQVCETLRGAGNNMPILILTARTLTEDRTRGFDVGADQYLTKPFELEEFLSRVKNLLKLYSRRLGAPPAAEAAPRQYQFGTAVVDFDAFIVTVAETPVRMTQLEMKLLEYFITNEGRMIPRRELLENVWGMAGTISTRAPDQFIRRLRKTFEIDPAKPQHFLTIRDAGYKFVAAPE
jgi:DNA-binding response OmpR family regulator